MCRNFSIYIKKTVKILFFFKKIDPYEQAFKISESANGAVDFIDIFFEEAFLNHDKFDEKIVRLFQAFFLIEKIPYQKTANDEEMTKIIKQYIIDKKISYVKI